MIIQSASRLSTWGAHNWAIAGAIPGAFFAFEAVSISTYPALRAPNVSVVQQIVLVGCFFTVWLLVPRLVWWRMPDDPFSVASPAWRRAGIEFAVLGAALACIHLMLLTALLRYMHAPPGGRLGDFLYSFGETMLGQAPIWLLAYAVAVVVIALVKPHAGDRDVRQLRIEVRDRGRARLIELSEIEWVQASGNYVEFHLVEGMVLARQSLQSLKEVLAASGFIASHRSTMVNPRHVASIRPGGEGESHFVVLKSGAEVPLSRRKLKGFRGAVLKGQLPD